VRELSVPFVPRYVSALCPGPFGLAIPVTARVSLFSRRMDSPTKLTKLPTVASFVSFVGAFGRASDARAPECSCWKCRWRDA
jgi:hypothetical protein